MFTPFYSALIGLSAMIMPVSHTMLTVSTVITAQTQQARQSGQELTEQKQIKRVAEQTPHPAISPEDKLRFFPGIIGSDDRVIIENAENSFAAIGRVNIAGYASRSACTGILVGPNMALTASTCLRNQRTGQQFLTQQIHFVTNQKSAPVQNHGKAQCIRYMAPPDRQTDQKKTLRNPPTPYRSEIALILLDRNLGTIPAKITAGDTKQTKAQTKLIHPHYSRERPFLLSADMNCTLQANNDTSWSTDCDTNFGGAGGPLLTKGHDDLNVAAIMVNVIPGEHTIAIPAHRWRALLNITSCDMR